MEMVIGGVNGFYTGDVKYTRTDININITNYNIGFTPMVGMLNPQMLMMMLMMLMMMQGGMGFGGFPGMFPGMPGMPGMPLPITPPVLPPTLPPVLPPITPPPGGCLPYPQPLPMPLPGPIAPQPPIHPPSIGHLEKNKAGQQVYTTPGGWKIIYDPKKHVVEFISPDGKKTTKVWGDPHVKEADGSQWQWKNKTATFMLPDGTKVTLHATGPKGVVTGLDIYTAGYGDHVSMNQKGEVKRSLNTFANYWHDQMTADGDTFYTTNDGKDWHVLYRENVPGQRNYKLKDSDAKKAENWHQRIENILDGFKRRKVEALLGGTLGALLGTALLPGVGTLLGGLLGAYLGTKV